jgi:branched-chain amino acid transport system permease protein
VMYAPGGIASLLAMNMRVAAYGMFKRLWGTYLALGATALVVVTAVAVMVEMIYHIKLNEALGPVMHFAGVSLDTRSGSAWGGAVILLVVGVGLLELARRRFVAQWSQIQEDIEVIHLRKQPH